MSIKTIPILMLLAISLSTSYALGEIQIPDSSGNKTIANLIFSLEDSAMEEWRKGNPMRWAEIAADDISYIDPGLTGPITGKEAYIEYLKPLIGKVKYDGSDFVKPRVAIYHSTAVLTYNYSSLSKDKNGSLKRRSFWNTTEVYSLINGNWKIVHTHWSFIKHSLPKTLDMPIPVIMKKNKTFTGEAAEIMKLETSAMNLWRKGDPDGFLELSSDDVTYFNSDTLTRLNGISERTELYNKMRGKISFDVMEFINPRIQMYGDTAVLTYQFLSTSLNKDGTIKRRTPWNCSEVYAKINGSWNIVHTHWSFINGTIAKK